MKRGHGALLALIYAVLATCAAAKENNDAKGWRIPPPAVVREVLSETEPNGGCPGKAISCGDVVREATLTSGDVDAWEFFAPLGSRLSIWTERSGLFSPNLDTVLELAPAGCDEGTIASDDDSGPDVGAYISDFVVPATGMYHLMVRGFDAAVRGGYTLYMQCAEAAPPPSNDTCPGATPLSPCGSGLESVELTDAQNDYDPAIPGPSCTGLPAEGRDVVYSVALGAGDTFTATYQTQGDGVLYLVTDCDNVSGSCVLGSDNQGQGGQEVVQYTAPAAGTYFLIIDSFGLNTGGPGSLVWEVSCPAPVQGACCLDDGSCFLLAEDICLDLANGRWLGFDVACDPNPCAGPFGACCIGDLCMPLTEAECLDQGAAFVGEGSTCDPFPCGDLGGCCFPLGACAQVSQLFCAQSGGVFLGSGASCDPNPCVQPVGACCLENGDCLLLLQSECDAQAGQWLGPDPPCAPNPCPGAMGACCLQDGSCFSPIPEDACVGFAQGTFLGRGTSCDPYPCGGTPPGACCVGSACFQAAQSTCVDLAQGTYLGDGTLCDPNPCGAEPIVGACCVPGQPCVIVEASLCSGEYQGDGTVCDPDPCAAPLQGACCLAGHICVTLTLRDCSELDGNYLGDGQPCSDPNPCQPPVPTEETSWGALKARYR